MTAIEHLIEHCKPHRTIVRAALLQSMLEINSPFHVLIHFSPLLFMCLTGESKEGCNVSVMLLFESLHIARLAACEH